MASGVQAGEALDEDLAVVAEADAFLRQVRFGRDGAESTSKAYAGGIALFLRWCRRTGRDWRTAAADFGLFMTWLRHAPREGSGVDAGPAGGGEVRAGPGRPPAPGARRVNAAPTAVRGV